MDMDVDGGTATEKIAILDAGAQYAKLIDRRVRELNCICGGSYDP